MDIHTKIDALCRGNYSNPYEILGCHKEADKYTVRTFLPMAREVEILIGKKSIPMHRVHNEGIFEAYFDKKPDYKIKMITHWDEQRIFYDPYDFDAFLTDFDLHLINEGKHLKIYEKLGAHIAEQRGIKGVLFAVWAPSALRVSVTGDFNGWDGRINVMRPHPANGVWELFIPGLTEGITYKFEVKSKYGNYLEYKTDPYAFYCELRPKTAAIVYDFKNKFKWNDSNWMQKRAKTDWLSSPVSIYELHLGSWIRKSQEENDVYTYREIADRLVPYVKEHGFTHIELLPVAEHPLDASWGYQVIAYYAPTSRFGKPEDLMYLIDKCHQNDIGVIIDWVPAHFPRDAHGLAFFDGTHLYNHADPRQGEHKEWGTLIFNYGKNEVKNFLIANAIFWLEKYHIDGLRVDAVASMLYLDYAKKPGEWLPNKYGGRENLEAVEFIKEFNETVHREFPGILTIAEESTSWGNVSRPTYMGGLGFSMKWDMGWMHDTLKYFSIDPLGRQYHSKELTFSFLYAFSENYVLALSHDEVVYGKKSMINKMPGDMWQKFANLRALYGYMYGHSGKKLMFMGCEFGQWIEWCFFKSLDWHLTEYEHHKKLQKYIADLNHLYKSEPAFYEVDFHWDGFEWIDFSDYKHSTVFFIRKAKDPTDFLLFAFNFTPVPRYNYRVGVPEYGFYKELLNSDSAVYWGSNMGNLGGVYSEKIPYHDRPFSISITLPPLSMTIFKVQKQITIVR